MESLDNFNLTSKQIVSAIVNEGLVLIKQKDLETLIEKASVNKMVDNRIKYVGHKEIKQMYGVTNYWLKKQREDPYTKLKCQINEKPVKYHVDSVREELERLAV